MHEIFRQLKTFNGAVSQQPPRILFIDSGRGEMGDEFEGIAVSADDAPAATQFVSEDVGREAAKIIIVNDGQTHVDHHSGGAQIGFAFCGQGRHDVGCRQGRMPLENGHEIRIAQHVPTVGMSKNCRLIAGNAAGQEQGAQVMARFLTADTADNLAYQPTNGRTVSAPRLARFVDDLNQLASSATPWISSSTASYKARK
jgi:hypothetical protein